MNRGKSCVNCTVNAVACETYAWLYIVSILCAKPYQWFEINVKVYIWVSGDRYFWSKAVFSTTDEKKID